MPHVKTRNYPNDWWQGAIVPKDKRVHQTQKPAELIKHLLNFAPEDGLVVDPFCGSGSTGVAALELGMSFAGCDLNEKCVNVANRLCGEAAENFEEKAEGNTVG